MLEIIGIIVFIQGALGFGGPAFFGQEAGLLHQWVDLPPTAYLGITVIGAVLTAAGAVLRRSSRADR